MSLLFFSSFLVTEITRKIDRLLNVLPLTNLSLLEGVWSLKIWFRASANHWVKQSPGNKATPGERFPLKKHHSNFSLQETGLFSYLQSPWLSLLRNSFCYSQVVNLGWQSVRRIQMHILFHNSEREEEYIIQRKCVTNQS